MAEEKMTLALACLTPEFVTLVADRRVTLGSDVLDDVATKVVVVCDRGVIAYSGLARFPTRGRHLHHWPRMDEWIVSTLSKYKVVTTSEAAKVLRNEATEGLQAAAGQSVAAPSRIYDSWLVSLIRQPS